MVKKRYERLVKSKRFEYFFYFVFLSFVIVFLFGGFLYFYFSNTLKEEAIKANNNTLLQLKNAQEAVLDGVDKSISNIVMDSTLNNYMYYYYSKDNMMLLAAQNKLSNTVILNEYIDSIYIYYINDKCVLSSEDGIISINDFQDADFADSLVNKLVSNNFVKSRTKKSILGKETGILSFVKTLPIINYGEPKAYVIMNIKASYLQYMIDTIKTTSDSNIVISDNEGNIISIKNDSLMSGNYNIIKDMVISIDKASEYFIKNINGRKNLVSYVTSEKYNWRYYYLIPMSKVTKGVSFLLQVTIFVGFLILLTSIITSFYLSKKLYSPIKNLLNLFNNSEINNSEVGNEVICIENSITTLINKNVNLENILKEYDGYLKNKFLQNLIHNKALDECIVAEKLQQYKINLNLQGRFFCYVISIDDTSEHIENNVEKQQSMLYIYLNEISNKVIFSKYKGFITELNDNNICIVINIDQNTEDKDTFYNLASDIHSLIQENIHYSVTIGKSDAYFGISSIPVCYLEAVAAVNYRLFTGYNQIIFYEKLHINQSTGMSYPFNLERNIISSLKMSRRDSVMSSLKDFINFIYSNPTNDYTVVKHHFLQLLCATIKCLYEMDRNFELVTLTGENIYSKILSVKTVGEAEICFNNLFNSVLNYTENQRNEQNKELIQSITTYIQDNLNEDLSIDSLATAFYISSSYLRKIFKEEIGITIKDYVDNERINKAKHLLQDTNNKISTIGENVGYTTVQTFVRAFKLQTGKTPGEYRTENVIKAKISL